MSQVPEAQRLRLGEACKLVQVDETYAGRSRGASAREQSKWFDGLFAERSNRPRRLRCSRRAQRSQRSQGASAALTALRSCRSSRALASFGAPTAISATGKAWAETLKVSAL